MCLIIKRIRHLNGKAKIAKRDILCFKVLHIRASGELQTPFQEMLITKDFIKNGLCADFLGVPAVNGYIFHGIHSYKDIQRAFDAAYRSDCVVCAYIPKGTKYWIGEHGQYVSECIKFN